MAGSVVLLLILRMGLYMQLDEELFIAVRKYRRLGRLNYYISFFLYFVAVASSISATLMAISGGFTAINQAIVTAVPGAALLITSNFRFSERASWHYDKKNQLNSLYRLFLARAPGTSLPEIAEKWNKIDSVMEARWPGFGTLGKSSNSSRE